MARSTAWLRRAVVPVAAAGVVRWVLLLVLQHKPFALPYDFLGGLEDVTLLASLVEVAVAVRTLARVRCPTHEFTARWAARLLAGNAVLCLLKLLARLLELPPGAEHPTSRAGFCAAVITCGCSAALEARWLLLLRQVTLLPSPVEVEVPLHETSVPSGAARGPARGDTQRHVRRLLGLAGEHFGWVLLGCLALLVRLPFSIAIPHFVSEGIGSAIDQKSSDPEVQAEAGNRAYWAVVGILGCGVLDSILDFFNFHLFVIVQQKVVRSLKLRLFESVMRQELAFFDAEPTGALMSRLTADTVLMSENISFVFRFSIEAVVRVVAVAGYMLVCSWRLAIVIFCLIPINAYLNRFYARWLGQNAKRSQDALAASNVRAQEAISGIQTVKAFGKEAFELSRYSKAVERYYELGIIQGVVTSLNYMIVCTFLMTCVVQAALIGYGVLLCWRGAMAPEGLVAFMLYRASLQDWVNSLFNSYTQLVRGAGAAHRVFELLDRVPQIQDAGRRPIAAPAGHIQFLDVHFAYASRPDSPVLQGFTLEALPGQCVALVGSSAAGKTTVIRLLVHLYEPQRGQVLLDGMDVRELDRSVLSARVGMVSQEPTLFRGSVEDNIRYACSVPHTARLPGRWRRWRRVWREAGGAEDDPGALPPPPPPARGAADPLTEQAARVANAHDFIVGLPEGYATEVGERGVQLSGGQRQRIAIARAVLSGPNVLLLDEATSALDTESEQLVQDALDRAAKGRTTLVIAHRLSTITKADVIAVMERGRVVEQGTHEELLEAGGRYRELWRRQGDLAC